MQLELCGLQGEETLAREAHGEISFFYVDLARMEMARLYTCFAASRVGQCFSGFGAAAANAFGPFGHNRL
jgi:hypothetical protein